MTVLRTSAVVVLAAALLLVTGFLAAPRAWADPKAKAEIQQKVKEAMENYDLLEYEEARKLLNQALTIGKRARLQNEPLLAKVHLALGIVYFAGLQDEESARLAFLSAVEIDPKVQIEPAYRTAEMAKLLDEARGVAGAPAEPSDAPAEDCRGVTGLAHELVDTGSAGAPLTMTARVGGDLKASRVAIHYRPQGAVEFVEVKMTKQGACTWTGTIPATGLRGELAHYYVAAYASAGKAIASKGSAGSPNIIELTASTGGGAVLNDDENPLGGRREVRATPAEHGVNGGAKVGKKKPARFYISLAAGSGGAFVTGETEQDRNEVQCCFAPALLHVFPELGFYLGPKTSLGAAFRMGFPIGANIPMHSTGAPAGLLRIRHWFGDAQDGFQVSGSVGGGVMRSTVKLSEAPEGMDVDIVATGPLLVGAGVGYAVNVAGPVKLVTELNAIAGVPVVDKLGADPGFHLNFGVHFDANLGLTFAF